MLTSRAEILIAMGKAGSFTDADRALLDMIHPLAESALKNHLEQTFEYRQTIEFLPVGQPVDDTALLKNANVTNDRVVFQGVRQGSSALSLSNTPVALTGLEVREDVGGYAGQVSGSFDSTTILTLGTDYMLDIQDATDPNSQVSESGILYRISGSWPTEPRSVKVTYYGGYTASELNGEAAGLIKLAAIKTVIHNYKSLKTTQDKTGAPISESIGYYSYSTDAASAALFGGAGPAVPPQVKIDLQKLRNYGEIFG